jgi:hypothetical protein
MANPMRAFPLTPALYCENVFGNGKRDRLEACPTLPATQRPPQQMFMLVGEQRFMATPLRMTLGEEPTTN